jgi:hypothetical protein
MIMASDTTLDSGHERLLDLAECRQYCRGRASIQLADQGTLQLASLAPQLQVSRAGKS